MTEINHIAKPTIELVWPKFVWFIAATGLAFAVSAIFSMELRWDRQFFLIPYIGYIGLFLAVYFKIHPVSLRQWIGHWPYAIAGTAFISLPLLMSIVSQPTSAGPEGWPLVLALFWVGLAYGTIDALLLNVFPVLIVQGASFYETKSTLQSRFIHGFIALLASLTMTFCYHLGYTEFQGVAIVYAMVGNAMITAIFLATGSPLSAVMAHVIMHTAAVLHGMETTLQVPPHY